MLKKITLTNFKCFPHMEVPLANLNILSGRNGVGKSNIIESLLLLRQGFKSKYLNGEYVNYNSAELFYDPEKELSVKLNSHNDSVEIKRKISNSNMTFNRTKDDDIFKEPLFQADYVYYKHEQIRIETNSG